MEESERRPADLASAYVLNMEANGLGVARTLGRQGIPVVGLDHRPWAPGLSSRYVRPLMCADMAKEPDAVLTTLIRAGEGSSRKGVLFPTSDAAVLFMSRHRRELAAHFEFMVPPERVQEAMVNKRLQYEEAVRLGVPMAETIFPRSTEDLREAIAGVRFPVFIKPVYSHLWFKTLGNKGLIVNNADELKDRMAKVFETGLEVMVQSILWPPGQDLYSVGAYFGRNGYVSPSFVWHKLRQYPPNFGVGSLVESVHQPEVAEIALRFMKDLEYRGIGYVEFKMDRNDGKWKMVELNARTGQTNALQAGAGMPLVLFEYQDLTGGPLPDVREYRDGVLWWDLLNDLDSFWRLRRRGELTLRQWARSWFEAEVYPYYAPDDIGPALRRYDHGLELARAIGNLIRMKRDEDAVPGGLGLNKTEKKGEGAAVGKGFGEGSKSGRGAD